jgi:hypothetical protein
MRASWPRPEPGAATCDRSPARVSGARFGEDAKHVLALGVSRAGGLAQLEMPLQNSRWGTQATVAASAVLFHQEGYEQVADNFIFSRPAAAPENARSSTSGIERAQPPARDQAIENRELFIQCMQGSERRRIAFDVVERNCRERFGHKEDGLRLFLELVGYVKRAQVDEALREFEKRFAPMLHRGPR